MCNGFLKLKVRRISKSSQDKRSSYFFTIINGQTFININLNIGKTLKRLFQPFSALLQSKHIILLSILPDCYNYFIKKRCGSFDDVVMTKGDRIKRSRENGYSFHKFFRFNAISISLSNKSFKSNPA